MASNYTAYESADDEAVNGVESLCRHLTDSGDFSPTTTPLIEEVERWLTTSYYWIQGLLAKAGLSTTQTASSILGILEQLNVYDVAVKTELSSPATNLDGEPNARFITFTERRDELMAMLTDGTLAAMGATVDSTAAARRTPVATGLSIARKKVAEDDTDRTQHRVRRNLFHRPDGTEPWAETDRS